MTYFTFKISIFCSRKFFFKSQGTVSFSHSMLPKQFFPFLGFKILVQLVIKKELIVLRILFETMIEVWFEKIPQFKLNTGYFVSFSNLLQLNCIPPTSICKI